MMQSIETYILQTREQRSKHLVLSDPCIERGGDSRNFRGLLAERLDTTIPSGSKIQCCHACNNPKCCNWKHLYWGTVKENMSDRKLDLHTVDRKPKGERHAAFGHRWVHHPSGDHRRVPPTEIVALLAAGYLLGRPFQKRGKNRAYDNFEANK